MPQAESLQQNNPRLYEHVLDPQVSLGEMVTKVGFEGLDQEARLEMIERATLDDYKDAMAAVHQKGYPRA